MVDNLRWLMWRLRSLVRRGRHEQELDEELRFHLETEAEERMAEGLAPEAARSTAVRSLGNTTLVRESTRMIWSWHW
ncbi:MAG TPA: permease prefix domain 1-containing protein, partial [Bryobacteraceae bacterium]|nr:permease prefix domain 1-containing protein [Bryobacteraceae bacterium]